MRKIIKCSQCNKKFYHGAEYRLHWEEKHLSLFIKREQMEKEKLPKCDFCKEVMTYEEYEFYNICKDCLEKII